MMTPEEQRIAIAEACGWGVVETHNGRLCGISTIAGYDIPVEIPNYPNDLNAMHEAEGLVVTNPAWHMYLHEVVHGRNAPEKDWETWSITLHATAAQRAEAFCRTLWPEKWKQ